MSELDWEEPPTLTVDVPRVRDWVGPAFEAWTALFWRRRAVFFWGPLFLVWAFVQFVKLWVYGAGVVVLLLANLVWIIAECITYPHRRKSAQRGVWTRYMLDLHERDV